MVTVDHSGSIPSPADQANAPAQASYV